MGFVRYALLYASVILGVSPAEASTYVTYDATVVASGTGYDRSSNQVYPLVLSGSYIITLDLSGLTSSSAGFFEQGDPPGIVYISSVQNAWGMIAQDQGGTTRSIFLTLRDGALTSGLYSMVGTPDALSSNISLPTSLYAQGGVNVGAPVLASFTTTFSSSAPPTGIGSTIRETVNVTSVPEPAAWDLMIVGFGVAGATMRRRASAVSYS